MLRNFSNGYLVNVAMRTFTEVFLVGFLRVLVPVARPHALTPSSLKREPKSTDAAEQIDKPKGFCSRRIPARLLVLSPSLARTPLFHFVTPFKNWARDVFSAAATRDALRIVGLRVPRSIPLM